MLVTRGSVQQLSKGDEDAQMEGPIASRLLLLISTGQGRRQFLTRRDASLVEPHQRGLASGLCIPRLISGVLADGVPKYAYMAEAVHTMQSECLSTCSATLGRV